MSKRIDSAHTPFSRFWLRLLLVQSTSWMGVLSLLSSNLVLAQTSALLDTAAVVPTVKDSKPPAIATLVNKSTPDKPQPVPAQAAKESSRRQVANSLTSSRVERLRQKLIATPTSARQEQQRKEVATPPAPQSSVVKVRSVVKKATKLPSPVLARPNQFLDKTATNAALDGNGAYIDKTDYNIGAAKGYSAPSALVLSERATGCKAVLRQGQGLLNSRCMTVLKRKTRVAQRGIQSINTVRLPRPQVPSWARRSRSVDVATISPIRLGPVSLSVNGVRATDNSTLQPIGQRSNANTRLLFPLSVPASITSLFGFRIHPITGDRRFHSGIDLGAPMGTPVLAAYSGKVANADFLGGYGLTVILEHNRSTQQTLYPHLSEIFVQPGQWVGQGTVIGRVGSTGNSTGPHLHFETRQLTPEGWVVTNPGVPLEYALTQRVDALHPNQLTQQLNAKSRKQETAMRRVNSPENLTATILPSTSQLIREGRVATDPGAKLEYALAQLVKALQANQSSQQSSS